MTKNIKTFRGEGWQTAHLGTATVYGLLDKLATDTKSPTTGNDRKMRRRIDAIRDYTEEVRLAFEEAISEVETKVIARDGNKKRLESVTSRIDVLEKIAHTRVDRRELAIKEHLERISAATAAVKEILDSADI